MNEDITKEIDGVIDDFMAISQAAAAGDYDKAMALSQGARLDEMTKGRIGKALETKDQYIVGRVLTDYKMRIAEALCDSCQPSRESVPGDFEILPDADQE